MERTPASRFPDVQASAPAIQVSLSRVGVTNVEKVIRIGPPGAEQLYYAKLDCFVDLGPEQKGAHMSRFEEVVNDVIGEVVLGESGFKAEQLAQHVAEQVRERQGARRAEMTIAARYPEHKPAPVSGIATQEIYTLFGSAVASERGTRRLVGVAAQGMTACPCAQELVAGRSRERLAGRWVQRRRDRADLRGGAGGHAQPARPGHALPRAARGLRDRRGRRGAARDRRGLDVERDLRAHEALRRGARWSRRPTAARASSRTACARRSAAPIERFDGLRDDAFVSARQENLETIHQHNVVAERFGLLGELRRELDAGHHVAHHTSMREWLDVAA